MKATDTFKGVIEKYLQGAAANDSLFAETLKKPNKNIDGCINYILTTVKKSGKAGFADEEIFQMATHYYDEDDIKDPGKVNCTVVVNHSVDSEATTAPAAPVNTIAKAPKNPKPDKKTSIVQPSFF